MRRYVAALAAAALVATLLSACGQAADQQPSAAAPLSTDASTATQSASQPPGSVGHHSPKVPEPRPLRAGEHRLTLTMPEAYTPSAPTDGGTDDYRCFLLDPQLTEPQFLTGTNVIPGNRDVVHHVILFQVPPDQAAMAEAKDSAESGEGWTCFGGDGLTPFQNVDDANWLGAWAPGGRESVTRPGYGVRMDPGTRIVMQVHYNLLAGQAPDTSATRLRLASAEQDLRPIETMLLPAPVELPCRAGHDQSPLCDRDTALADVRARFGPAGSTAQALYFLCGGEPRPGPLQSCTRTVREPMTVLGVAGHMHLLGRQIRVEVNPGSARAKRILDIPVWNFDDQGARPITPTHLDAGDTVKVTCKHVQWLRDRLPAFSSQRDDRYVLWGEGTTDEMCLGILQVTRP